MNKEMIFGAVLAVSFMVAPRISHARWMNPASGRFMTMDTFKGNQENSLSLHKYLYAVDDPVNKIDPTGNDALEAITIADISASLDALPGLSITSQKALTTGSTVGPDITKALLLTMGDVVQTYNLAPPSAKIKMRFLTPAGMGNGWDIEPLFDLGFGGFPDFGNGSKLGSGLGDRTVQFGNPPKVYYANAVNYILWGEMYSLLQAFYYDPTYSESAAVATAAIYKDVSALWYGYSADSIKEARAFVRYGYSTADPSSTALPLAPNPKNVGTSTRFKWKWLGLHDTFQ